MAEKNTNTGLTTEDIITLMREMSNTGLKSMEFSLGDSTIKLEGATNEQVVVAAPSEVVIANQAASLETKTTEIPTTNKQVGNEIKSPLVGVFYEAPQAGAKPFVKVGDKVKKGQTLAIIEAMKMMNEIESEFDGTVVDVFVKNEQGVEYGQPLFLIA